MKQKRNSGDKAEYKVNETPCAGNCDGMIVECDDGDFDFFDIVIDW